MTYALAALFTVSGIAGVLYLVDSGMKGVRRYRELRSAP